MTSAARSLSSEGCPNGPQRHTHAPAILLAVALFVAAVMLRSWGAAVLALLVGSSFAFVWGIRHEEDWAAGGALQNPREPPRGAGGRQGMEAGTVIDEPERLVGAVAWSSGLAELYRREYAPMVRLAHLLTGSNEAAEDVVQDSFVRLYRSWHRADQPGAYLRTIVVNRCRSWHRRQRMERDRLPRPVPDIVDAEARELLDALGRLGLRQRTALVLRFYADLSEADVAQALGCRPGTVKSLVHRGLRQMEGVIER